MHIEYWKCDYCGEIIDYDEKTKYTTPEMGYPFIPKGGGGKHFHYKCLVTYYNRKRKLTSKEKADLIEDAERRHNNQLVKLKIKQGNLTQGKLAKRKASKKERESLFNYFYDFYGLRSPTKNLNSLVDSLNGGEDFGEIRNTQIPYDQLKNMLVYYRNELDNYYFSKVKKGESISPLERIFIDIKIMINNLDDYLNRKEIIYNKTIHNQVDGGEKVVDNSKLIHYVPMTDEEFEKEQEWLDELKALADELADID